MTNGVEFQVGIFARLALLKPFFLAIVMLMAVEIALEFRHYRLGYNTVFFPKPSAMSGSSTSSEQIVSAESSQYGPVENFPFRSLVTRNLEPYRGNVIWVASASHAEHVRYAAKDVFPNRVCEFSALANCFVLNGSKAGFGIDDDIVLLEEYFVKYVPDYVLLYQMSQAIESFQGVITTKTTDIKSSNSILDYSFLRKTFQEFSLYQHLTDYLGGNIKLEGQLKETLPKEYGVEFEKQLIDFITRTRNKGAEPLLSTFSVSHNLDNLKLMPKSLKTNFVRYNSYLSPKGWVNTINQFNDVVRFVSIKEGVGLIDVAAELNGHPEYFVDFVHFNKKGHKHVAMIIANYFDQRAKRN
ncbi:hypothetical protein A3742_03110 [Oleiphilus sp. HI0071]|uniref:hypothetical protein n=1 Tax=Oleiphilus sp. HI0080 TaxID=1822255 RepID=UPI0007C34C42|nr:hypothetical protein [Oleiphilus sp. HI0080]KZY61036.1 hypothetical protein A3737_06110 [Oleiphilus sp. HI0065]KZY89750.1 hypothetical protein A3744_06260 [Oleiphilus sp. HI0073]KZY90302.1 hypothetical protein A3742_03110 [Oleiphilus sp. HI0071]KZZ55813.1 hypothetical protein A3760_00430 [Oleiphilus sp. HI0122]KZZ18770.1 hypothetical protein A3751_07045 [Oleiphilus sp. HI0080]